VRAGEEAAAAEFAMASEHTARKYARAEPVDAKLPTLPSPFAKPLEENFSCFAKNRGMAS
jgi:hypothetical protein